MPQYQYIAKDRKTKKEISDIASAKDEESLSQILKNEDLFLITAKQIKHKGRFSIFKKVSLKDKIFLTRNLQIMVSSGLSFSRSLKILSLQAKNERLKSSLLQIREDIEKGKSFSLAIKNYPDIFSKIFQSIIQLSEETGMLEENLTVLTKQLEKEYELKSKVKGALIYPAVIFFTMICVGIVMLVVVVPQLATIFDSMNVELPITTQIIIGLGGFFSRFWIFIPFIFIFIVYLIKILAKSKGGKLSLDSLSLKIPLVSNLIKKNNSAYIARTLDSLISSGISIIRGLEIISETVSNSYFKEAMIQSVKTVQEGSKLSEALREHSELYSLIMIEMIEVGEETGKTSEVLEKTAQFLEEEVFTLTKNMTAIIEPFLMIVMGLAVAFFAISMLMPMYSIIEVL